MPGRVQSRINIRNGDGTNKNPGLESAWRKHKESAKDTKSKFLITKEELKSILNSKDAVRSPIGITPGSGNFVREFDVGRSIGSLPLKDGPLPTSKIVIMTDKAGNLVNVYPGTFIYKVD